jgi:hypothetical protein
LRKHIKESQPGSVSHVLVALFIVAARLSLSDAFAKTEHGCQQYRAMNQSLYHSLAPS